MGSGAGGVHGHVRGAGAAARAGHAAAVLAGGVQGYAGRAAPAPLLAALTDTDGERGVVRVVRGVVDQIRSERVPIGIRVP